MRLSVAPSPTQPGSDNALWLVSAVFLRARRRRNRRCYYYWFVLLRQASEDGTYTHDSARYSSGVAVIHDNLSQAGKATAVVKCTGWLYWFKESCLWWVVMFRFLTCTEHNWNQPFGGVSVNGGVGVGRGGAAVSTSVPRRSGCGSSFWCLLTRLDRSIYRTGRVVLFVREAVSSGVAGGNLLGSRNDG